MPWFWSKTDRTERKKMVVADVTRMEDERYKIKAVLKADKDAGQPWRELSTETSLGEIFGRSRRYGSASPSVQYRKRIPVFHRLRNEEWWGLRPPTNAGRPGTQSWPLSTGRLAGRLPSFQWRLDAKAMWGCQSQAF